MSELKDIKKIVERRSLSLGSAQITEECMIELCEQCGLKKKLAKLGSIFEHLTEGIIVFDLNLNVVDANDLGKSIQKEFKQFYINGEDYKLNKLPILAEVLNNSNSSHNIEIVSFDYLNKKHFFTAGCSPVFSERNLKVGVCLVISDITEIQKKSKQLEDIVSALTHDLKTPLVAAETSYKHLLDGYFGPLNKNQEEIVKHLSHSNSDALKLVKNLLNVFKYEARSYKLLIEKVDVGDLIEKSIQAVKPMLEERNITLKVFPSAFQFYCDPFEIERVLVNLLSNSIKYIQKDGVIEIKAIKNENGTVIFTVEDNGKGISKDDMANLFERFWQSKRSEDKSNSTGLGLYLSRQIIESHGGKIWAESEVGKGTKVIFEIPEIMIKE